jgi:hypothetical protein
MMFRDPMTIYPAPGHAPTPEQAEAITRMALASPRLAKVCQEAFDFLEQPVRDGDKTVPLRFKLVMIGGEYISKRLAHVLADALATEPAEVT